MKVAIVGHYPTGRAYGGVAVHNYHLASSLSKIDNIELHIVTLGEKIGLAKKDNKSIHIVKRFHFPIDALTLSKRISKINPDIVHAQGTYFPYSTASALLSNKYPTLLTVHGLIKKEVNFKSGNVFIIENFIGKPLEKYALLKIKNIIVCSPAMKKEVSNITNSQIYIIPNGINLNEIQTSISYKNSIDSTSILYLGLLNPQKGVDLLIRAIQIIKKQIPKIHAYIVGTGPDETKLKRLVKKLNLEKNISFIGFIQDI